MKVPFRLSVRIGGAERNERIGSNNDADKLSGIESAAHVLVVVAQQKLGFTPQHHLLTGLHAVRHQIKVAERKNSFIAANPLWKESPLAVTTIQGRTTPRCRPRCAATSTGIRRRQDEDR